MESPFEVRPSWRSGPAGPERLQEQSFSTTLEIGRQLAVAQSDSVVALGAGAIANSVSFKWLGNRTSFLRMMGFPRVISYSAMARFKFGNGAASEVEHAADIKFGVAGCRGASAAFVFGSRYSGFTAKGCVGSTGRPT